MFSWDRGDDTLKDSTRSLLSLVGGGQLALVLVPAARSAVGGVLCLGGSSDPLAQQTSRGRWPAITRRPFALPFLVFQLAELPLDLEGIEAGREAPPPMAAWSKLEAAPPREFAQPLWPLSSPRPSSRRRRSWLALRRVLPTTMLVALPLKAGEGAGLHPLQGEPSCRQSHVNLRGRRSRQAQRRKPGRFASGRR